METIERTMGFRMTIERQRSDICGRVYLGQTLLFQTHWPAKGPVDLAVAQGEYFRMLQDEFGEFFSTVVSGATRKHMCEIRLGSPGLLA